MIDACARSSLLGKTRLLLACAAVRPARPDRTVLAISKRQSFVILFPMDVGSGRSRGLSNGRNQTRKGRGWLHGPFYYLRVPADAGGATLLIGAPELPRIRHVPDHRIPRDSKRRQSLR